MEIVIVIGYLNVILILILNFYYTVFAKKENVTSFYIPFVPFDVISGQDEVEFHEEQKVLTGSRIQGTDELNN